MLQIAPGRIVVETEHHHRLDGADQTQPDEHPERHIAACIFHILRDRDRVLRSDEEPECHRGHRNHVVEAAVHDGGLVHRRSCPQSEHAEKTHDQHRAEQQVAHQILHLREHVDAVKVGDQNDDGGEDAPEEIRNRKMQHLPHGIGENRRLHAGRENIRDHVAAHHQHDGRHRAHTGQRVLGEPAGDIRHQRVQLGHRRHRVRPPLFRPAFRHDEHASAADSSCGHSARRPSRRKMPPLPVPHRFRPPTCMPHPASSCKNTPAGLSACLHRQNQPPSACSHERRSRPSALFTSDSPVPTDRAVRLSRT